MEGEKKQGRRGERGEGGREKELQREEKGRRKGRRE